MTTEPTTQDPTAWFDQFDTTGIGASSQWCARHWAPCPVFDANGIGMTVELLQIFTSELCKPGSTAEQMDEQLIELGPICCKLGDVRMYDLWGHWGPASP